MRFLKVLSQKCQLVVELVETIFDYPSDTRFDGLSDRFSTGF